MAFSDYFGVEQILADLIRWRVAGKCMRDDAEAEGAFVSDLLPPRKMWSRTGARGRRPRDGARRRRIDPVQVRRRAIRATVLNLHRRGELAGQAWGRKLLDLVARVQGLVRSGDVRFAAPRLIRISKGFKDGVRQYRQVASFDRLEDRLVLSRATAYLKDRLEEVLTRDCYSFRRDGRISHVNAVQALQAYRAKFPDGALWVAERDIKSFFDGIPHATVRTCWRAFAGWDGAKEPLDPAAEKVLEAYLAAYRATGVDEPAKGLPQGGSFSTVLANLVLRDVDVRMRAIASREGGSDNLFYARYCDDVVLVSPRREVCAAAADAYAEALGGLGLEMHRVEDFTYGPDYYEAKSKGPFRWCAEAGEGRAPWLSFLGSQVRFDGATRIRMDSIRKHVRSLGRITAQAVDELESGLLAGASPQEASCWFNRFRNRLIAKGVGYVTAKVQDCDACWTAAFSETVTKCPETRRQMRFLDRVRAGMLCKVRHLLPSAYGAFRHRYKGRPFSYAAFLEQSERPTNMNPPRRPRRVHLPYSAL